MKTMATVLAATVMLGAAMVCAGNRAWAGGGPAAFAKASTKPAEAAPKSTAAATGAQVMATVNGQPIYMDEINEILLYSKGLPVAQQLIANELVRQECVRQKVAVTDQDVQRQHDQALFTNFPTLDARQREQALEKYLSGERITRKQWNFTMRRLAMLTKLAEPMVKITDDDLQQAFGETYGRNVVVRHIMVASLADAQDVLSRLEKGAEFTQLVTEKSLAPTKANGGFLKPISRSSTDVPPSIKDAALSLTKVGQISPVVQAGTVFHVLKLDRIIPLQNVRFEDVKEKLRQQVHDVQIQMLWRRILDDLITEAKNKGSVDFANPILRRVWQDANKREDVNP